MNSQNTTGEEDQSNERIKTRSSTVLKQRRSRAFLENKIHVIVSSDEENVRSSSRIKLINTKKLKYKEANNLQSSKLVESQVVVAPKRLKKISTLPINWCVTQVSASRYTFKWTLQNFSLFHHKNGEALSSSKFKIPHFANLECNLLLYPNGHEKNCKNTVCITLQCLAQDSLDIDFELTYLNKCRMNVAPVSNGKKKTCSGELLNSEPFCVKTKSNLISLLKEDVLIILCSLSINERIIHKTSRDSERDFQSVQSKLEVLSDLYKLTKKKDFCDVILCIENQEFSAHKAILVARSSFFEKMFDRFKDREIKKYNIEQIKSSAFEEILRFIYTGQILDIKNSASDLLELAHKLELSDLKTICERYLIKNLSLDNVFQNLILAENFSASHLKQKAKNMIVAFSTQIVNSPDFKLIKNLSFDLYQEILCLALKDD